MNFEIYNEDCIKTMERFEDGGIKVDLVLTSPPYNNSRRSCTDKSRIKIEYNKYDVYNDLMTNEEYYNWSVELFKHFDKILNPNSVVLYNINYSAENAECLWLTISNIIQHTNFVPADCVIWKKKSALPVAPSPNKLTRITEFVFVMVRKDELKTYRTNKKVVTHNSKGQPYYEIFYNLFEASNNDGSCKLNKATFSSDFVVELLKMYARDNYVVYDPFNGTGTTCVGCFKYNPTLTYYGSEISPNQCEYSRNRVNEILQRNTNNTLDEILE